MAKFKCTHSGTILEFKSIHDVQEMRKHPEYIEVLEDNNKKVEAVVESKVDAVVADPVKKSRGRPRKVVLAA